MFLSIFNGCEAAFWFLLALFVVIRCRSASTGVQRWSRITAVWLILFGISDVFEIFTGAWWRPQALLVLKGACVCGLIISGRKLFHNHRHETEVTKPDDTQPGGGD